MRTLGNFLWFVFCGFWTWLLWAAVSAIAFISIIGIPWGRACWNISTLAAAPFGKDVINRYELTQKRDIGTSFLGSIGNIVWFILAGVWIAIVHTISGIVCCVTLVGIPFGLQHFKLAGLAIAPIGKAVVSRELAETARQENARANLEKVRAGTPIHKIKDDYHE
ncbi:YccF domain-containing protein [Pandoraea sp.]|uniref:YccF domain-containing protein n=1 Tax=Pandoraea sp. TaxID=1883445 RepID=UPI0012231005|nr:YccF domain-containing protein [Pandoraea sp.]TAL55275.1 MAG: YccF domain-containing protein [Pandoraea sp.]TAM18193.1 MAG: YccF domain-containing protein [Pandoraea sp.]